MVKRLKGNKAFTLIELLAVIGVLGVLVLLATPKLLNYIEEAELVGIQHDVKIMEQEIEIALIESELDIDEWNKNKKNLGALAMQNKLFEREGVAERIDASHLANKSAFANKNTKFAKMSNEDLGIGGMNYTIKGENDLELTPLEETYKVVPEEYKKAIKTKLDGTFYTNKAGKVYYEHSKSIMKEKNVDKTFDCPLPSPDYDFEPETGTIVKWYGTETNLVIPEFFKVTINEEEECVPVRVIGEAAFMKGGIKNIEIPQSIGRIEKNSFRDNQLTEVNISHSVKYIGEGSFAGNNFSGSEENSTVTIKNNPSNITIMPNAFGDSIPKYKSITPDELNVIFHPSSGTIISGQSKDRVITIPEYFSVGGVEYPVKQIDKGAYQGLGLISVILPSSLERIEDYAFAGNQLEGISIPDKVNHIGNYAFAFNEVIHSKKDRKKSTIEFIDIKKEEQFDKVNKDYGDIYENNVKVNMLKEKINLLSHIFVTSIGNHVIDEKYIGLNEEVYQDVVLSGLKPEAFDGDLKTYSDTLGNVKWVGDLENREITITTYSSTRNSASSYGIYIAFYDKDGKELFPIGSMDKRLFHSYGKTTTSSVIVPEGSERLEFTSILGDSPVIKIHEIELPEDISLPSSIGNVDVETNHHGVYMKWKDTEENMRYAIYRDNVFLEFINEPYYNDISLYSDNNYSYEIIPINKYGNAGSRKNIKVKTNIAPILYSGLQPEAFDNNLNTYSSTLGNVTWEGDLGNKEISITTYSSTRNSASSYGIYIAFYDKDGKELFPIGSMNKRLFHTYGKTTTSSVIVPKNSERIEFTSRLGDSPVTRVYEVTIPENMSHPSSVGNVDVETNHHGVSMSWKDTEEGMRYAVYRDNVFLEYVNKPYYNDNSLYSDHDYSYEIIPINKYGNAGPIKNIKVKTDRPNVVFRGLKPEAFDNNLSTYSDTIGNVTWEGDLDNKEISITTYSSTRNSASSYGIYIAFYGKDGNQLFPEGTNKSIFHTYGKTTTSLVIVPEDSERIEFTSRLGGSPVTRIYDVSVK